MATEKRSTGRKKSSGRKGSAAAKRTSSRKRSGAKRSTASKQATESKRAGTGKQTGTAKQTAGSARTGANKRESGRPGGGQGRRDEVGRSGVYPASAGHAPADAEIRAPASWGQGERGAEGYEDSGRSGLVMRGGEVLGGYSSSDMDRDTDRFADREDVAERRDEQGSYGPGAGGERMSGRGGQEESGEEKSPR